MKRMTKSWIILLAVLTALFTACGKPDSPEQPSSSETPSESSQQSEEAVEKTYTLCGDFTMGGTSENIKTREITGTSLDGMQLAKELSDWTGLDFTLNSVRQEGKKLIVDWSKDSTLVANLDDREQKEEFFFYDVDSLRWFMMDSLCQTLLRNLDAEEIYYTCEGGDLYLEYLSPKDTFTAEEPYLGCAAYMATDDEIYAPTEGLWRLDGEEGTASIYMDGTGRFESYYASGSVEASGYLSYEESEGRYDMYTDDGTFVNGFYFDSDTSLHMGNDSGFTYLLDGASDSGQNGNQNQSDAPAVLVREGSFTGTTPLETDNDYFGGYRYSELTEDEQTVIVNACFATTREEEEAEGDYIRRTVEMVFRNTVHELHFTDDAEISAKLTYPAKLVHWTMGDDTSFREGDAVFFQTDTHTFLYAFDTTPENSEVMQETWNEAFHQLTLV